MIIWQSGNKADTTIYIDCKNWAAIEREMHLSRRACFDYQNRALEKLLGFKKVRAALKEYEKEKF